MRRTMSPAARASRLKMCFLERSLPLVGGILGLSWVGLSEKPVSQAFVPERSLRAGPRIRLSHSNRPYPRTVMSWEISGSMWATLGGGAQANCHPSRKLVFTPAPSSRPPTWSPTMDRKQSCGNHSEERLS